MFRANITVTLRASILDPQGKAIEHGVHSLGYPAVSHVRIGKHVELDIDTNDRGEADRIVKEVCQKVLANPVMEDFAYTLEEAKQREHA